MKTAKPTRIGRTHSSQGFAGLFSHFQKLGYLSPFVIINKINNLKVIHPTISLFLIPLIICTFFYLLVLIIDMYFKVRTPFLSFMFSVLVTSLYGGYLYGAVGLVISMIYSYYFNHLTMFPFLTENMRSLGFEIGGIFIVWVCGRQHRLQTELETVLNNEHQFRLKAQKTAAQLKQNRTQFQKLFDSNILGISIWNKSGKVLSANDAYLKITGHSRRDLDNGKINWIEMTPQNYMSDINRLIEKWNKSDFVEQIEKEYIRKDGTKIPVIVGASMLDVAQGLGTSYVMDNTTAKQKEQQKDNFIAIAGHEIRNPLASIKAYNQIIESRLKLNPDTKTINYLVRVNDQVNKLNNLVDDLLDVSKITTGNIQLRIQYYDFDSFIKNILQDLTQTITSHKLLLHGKAKTQVAIDKEKFGQVLINLITNAVKYSPESDRVLINIHKKKSNLEITIRDFGVGINPRDQKRIFELFYRTEYAIKSSQGLGLGLYISNQIVKLHGGSISVSSVPAKGSTFKIILPISFDTLT